jgi:hypothetical protein
MTKAEQTYLENYNRARAAIRKIEEMIHDMPAPEGEVKILWTHVGDMGHVADQLESILPEA